MSDSTYFDDFPGLEELVERAGIISGVSQNVRVAPLAGDGSDRKFFRIFHPASSMIGLLSPRVKKDGVDENDSYFLIGRHLHSKGLPVPRILYADVEKGKFILEDAGDLHLQSFVRFSRTNPESVYRHVITMLGALHTRAREGFVPEFCFDAVLYDPAFVYERELEYFRESFVNGCLGLGIARAELRPDFEALAETAGVHSSSFVFHRDFQSRNIMVHRARLWLLDFQGMRFGPPAYDLASLLLDPYVKLPLRLQDKLVGAYWACAGWRQGGPKGDFIRKFEAVRLARSLQVLGAFGHLGIRKGKRQFLEYIPFAVDRLAYYILQTGQGRFPRLAKLAADIRRRLPELARGFSALNR
jgi:hypothetical protein